MFADMAILSSPRAATTSSSSLGSTSSTSPKKQQHQQPPNHFPTPTSSEILSAVYPFFHSTLQLQQLVLTTTLQLLLNILIASRAIIFRALTTSRLVVLTIAQLIWRAWDSKQSRRFRKRLEFELFVLLLGPLGNMMFLMLFWPGWVMLALGLWAWWK